MLVKIIDNVSLLSMLIIIIKCYQIISSSNPCRPPFGCFPFNSDFYDIFRRPYNPDPQYPEDIQVKFYLYSKWFRPGKSALNICGPESIPLKHDHIFKPCVITTNDLLNTGNLTAKLDRFKSYNRLRNFFSFDNNDKNWLAMIVHGFKTNSSKSSYLSEIKNLLLTNRIGRRYQVTVIVDWGQGCRGSYPQACSNARLVAAEAAYLLRILLQKFRNIDTDHVHLIGHSLGAHIAGYIGKNFTKTGSPLGRITGLDPAGPFFDHLPATVRLDRSDGQFVDVIHTNAKASPYFSFGISHSIGHIDFFPNNGRHQPGCKDPNDKPTKLMIAKRLNIGPFIQNKLLRADSCDHYRAPKLFLTSIPRKDNKNWCPYQAANCANWKEFSRDRCAAKFFCPNYVFSDDSVFSAIDHQCAQMGFFAYEWAKLYKNNSRSVNFYLRTFTDQKPFCR